MKKFMIITIISIVLSVFQPYKVLGYRRGLGTLCLAPLWTISACDCSKRKILQNQIPCRGVLEQIKFRLIVMTKFSAL